MKSNQEELDKEVKNDNATDLKFISNATNSLSQIHYASSEVISNNNELCAERTLNSFTQCKRYYERYSSNLNMLPNAPHSFNYLRYAKANELRKNERNTPKISVKNLCVTSDNGTFVKNCLSWTTSMSHHLQDISFTLKGGDTLAILYAKESEMRILLEIMSNNISKEYLINGIIENNGHKMNINEFGDRVAYVNAQNVYPWLTVAQTLYLQSLFVTSDRNTFNNVNMMEQLIQTLALSSIRNFLCNELTIAERQRLKIALQILKDADILLSDNIMKDINLYEMAFLIDYLRDWAIKLNRIVIMAVQPPTIEILTMFHKVLLIASGKVIYFGLSSQMLAYFEQIGFPCPSFKNPCDYYVDLVTHDYLTTESSLESINRIKRLTEIWKERIIDECEAQLITTDQQLSPKIHRVNCYRVAFLIYRRFFEIFLNRSWIYFKEPIYAFLISLFVGFIFFQIPTDRYASINARFGFIISMLAICLLPNLFIHIERVFDERLYLLDDVRNKLYDPTFYIMIKITYDLPISIICNILYALPAYILSGLPLDVILLSNSVMLSGFLIHPNSFPALIKLLYYYNPTKLAGALLAENEFLRRTALTDWVTLLTSLN
ncbi:RE11181p, putative [Brugia malayi]|uniref:RE11181p, putative n=1 Tax=Brugia malayi TaxID=6279 RepID=A0A4E9FAC0_BRUMA|nr:RE11181p, putative [Brugia malayi]VIO93118.1 RE11181p, putative [Brugia malayi]